MGIGVWLVPPPSEAKLLKQLMCFPPSLESPPYTLPSFEPHITIASFPSSIPLDRLRSAFFNINNSQNAPRRVDFTSLSVGDAYFRSVVIDVAPTRDLHTLREQVKQALPEYDARSLRFPHLSLFYIPDEYAADRERVHEAIWDTYGVRLTSELVKGERIAFDVPSNTGDGEKHRLEGFYAEEVWIVRCEGPAEEWMVLEKINLVPLSD